MEKITKKKEKDNIKKILNKKNKIFVKGIKNN